MEVGILIGIGGIFIGLLWKRSADRQARRLQERLEAGLQQGREERARVLQLVGALVEQGRLQPRDAEPIVRMLEVTPGTGAMAMPGGGVFIVPRPPPQTELRDEEET